MLFKNSVLGKSLTHTTAAFLKIANELKQTIGKLPVPTAGMKVVVDTLGSKILFPDIKLTKLGGIV